MIEWLFDFNRKSQVNGGYTIAQLQKGTHLFGEGIAGSGQHGIGDIGAFAFGIIIAFCTNRVVAEHGPAIGIQFLQQGEMIQPPYPHNQVRQGAHFDLLVEVLVVDITLGGGQLSANAHHLCYAHICYKADGGCFERVGEANAVISGVVQGGQKANARLEHHLPFGEMCVLGKASKGKKKKENCR